MTARWPSAPVQTSELFRLLAVRMPTAAVVLVSILRLRSRTELAAEFLAVAPDFLIVASTSAVFAGHGNLRQLRVQSRCHNVAALGAVLSCAPFRVGL